MSINQKQKELIKVYLALFAIALFITNWNSLSWAFNYRVVTTLVHDFFAPYPDSPLLVSASEITLPPRQYAQNTPANTTAYPYSPKDNSIELPVLGISAPLIIAQKTEIQALEKDLNNGAVYYPGSVLPGEYGQIVILGHSAPPNWPKIKYDWIFSDIEKLNAGDQIMVYFNNRQYIYKVTQKSIIKAGQEIDSSGLNGKNNIMVLVSCWPPGKNYQRIAVYSELEELTN